MIALVIGGAGSGKSAYAERLCLAAAHRAEPASAPASSLPPARAPLYVATMPRDGADAEQRIERHRRLRAGKGFALLERSLDLAAASVPPSSAALLECLGTLMANELFRSYPNLDAARAESAVLSGIDHLAAAARDVIVVTNDIFADGAAYDEATMAYIDALAAVNRTVAARVDAVVEVVCGIPLWRKGAEPDWMGDR